MKNYKGVNNLNFSRQSDPIVIAIANELATNEHKAPIDSIRLLILQAGASKLAKFQAERNKDYVNDFLPRGNTENTEPGEFKSK